VTATHARTSTACCRSRPTMSVSTMMGSMRPRGSAPRTAAPVWARRDGRRRWRACRRPDNLHTERPGGVPTTPYAYREHCEFRLGRRAKVVSRSGI
jgi:hypothetical protein